MKRKGTTMPTNLADDAAAIAAGYKKVQTDFGASAVPRYQTCYSEPISGYAGGSGSLSQAQGRGSQVHDCGENLQHVVRGGVRAHARFSLRSAQGSGSRCGRRFPPGRRGNHRTAACAPNPLVKVREIA